MNLIESKPSSRGETEKHQFLKALALSWAHQNNFMIVAPEVSFPHRRFRFDLAAYKMHSRVPEKIDFSGDLGISAVFECKQSRADLLKDCKMKSSTATKLRGLYARKNKLEELLKVHLLHLSRGEELFPEFDSYRLEESRHKTYHTVLTRIRETQNALAYKTKFDRLLQYRVAHLHYLVTEPDIAEGHDIPLGWGHLVRCGDHLELKEAPLFQKTDSRSQHIFLQRIALAGSSLFLAKTAQTLSPAFPVKNPPCSVKTIPA